MDRKNQVVSREKQVYFVLITIAMAFCCRNNGSCYRNSVNLQKDMKRFIMI